MDDPVAPAGAPAPRPAASGTRSSSPPPDTGFRDVGISGPVRGSRRREDRRHWRKATGRRLPARRRRSCCRVIDGDERAWDEVVTASRASCGRWPARTGFLSGNRRRGADGLAAPRRTCQPDPPTGTPGVVAGHDDEERGIAGDQGQQPPESAVDRRGRADDAIRGGVSRRRWQLCCGFRAAVPGGSAAHAAALRGASPRLPDHRRDARPTYREHRADQGPVSGAPQAAPSSWLQPERRTLGDPTDDELLELVGRALRIAEPVPDRVIAGEGGVDLADHRRGVGRVGVRLGRRATGVRSEDTARQLTFRAPGSK